MLERLILDRLEAETETSVSPDQHGFTKRRSTIGAIRDCLDWADGRKKKLVVGVFLDISGAFDNLDWQALLEDLNDLGASGVIRSIIRSYLTRRSLWWKDPRRALSSPGGAPRVHIWVQCCGVAMDKALKIGKGKNIKTVARILGI